MQSQLLMKPTRPMAPAFVSTRSIHSNPAIASRAAALKTPAALPAFNAVTTHAAAPCTTSSPAKQPRKASLQPCAAAAASAVESPAGSASEQKEWYALLANAEFFLNDVQNESLAEQLRERVRFFKETNRPIDFYMVPEPKWLDAKYPSEAKQVKRPCVALVSTDKVWITFMKLRLDRVLRIDLGPVGDAEALSVGGELPSFTPPEKWTAPYSRYSAGWWNVFLPK